ncbi:MAG: hypothetical protein O2954_18290 [bacterium]|nr:hypothetical protein [bacterium]
MPSLYSNRAIRFFLLFFLTGCATYSHNAADLRASLVSQNYERATASLKDVRKGPARLLYLLENGLVAHSQRRYESSNRYFAEAEFLADQLFTRSLSREVASLITNDTVRYYRGEEFELVFIHYYRALNYWYLGLPEDALVECRKANLKLARYATQAEYETSYKNDAFMHYLTGLFYEATGELNDAWVSYKNAQQAYEHAEEALGVHAPPALSTDLRRVEDLLDGKPHIRLTSSAPANGEIILFSEIGFIPRKIEEEISLPLYETDIRTARSGGANRVALGIAGRRGIAYYNTREIKYWLHVALPAYKDTPPATRTVRVFAANQSVRSVPAQNLAAIAQQTFQDKQPVLLARTIARSLVKYAAADKISEKNKVLGFLANLFTAASESADTRSWSSLPNKIHMGRLSLPPGTYTVTIECLDAYDQILDIKVLHNIRVHTNEKTFLNDRFYK